MLTSEMANAGVDQVRSLERRRIEATRANDADALAPLLHDSLIYVNSVGAIYDKQAYLRDIRTHALTYDRDFDVRETETRVLDDIIILVGVMLGHSRLDGEQQVFHFPSIAVWRKDSDAWRLLAWQSSSGSQRFMMPVTAFGTAGILRNRIASIRGSQERAAKPPETNMSNDSVQPEGPDFRRGVKFSSIADGAMLNGRVGDVPALLVRRDGSCSPSARNVPITAAARRRPRGRRDHPLSLAPCLLRACAPARSLRAPARDPLPRWRVEVRDGIAYVREKSGAAGSADACRRAPGRRIGRHRRRRSGGQRRRRNLRREGYAGPITMLSADADAAVRPAEPFQRLSRRHRARRLDPAAAGRFLPGQCIDVRLESQVDARSTSPSAQIESRRWQSPPLTERSCLQPAPSRSGSTFPAPSLAHVHYLRTLADAGH